MQHKIHKYRLRKQSKIIGYAEQTPKGIVFSSKHPNFHFKKQDFTHVDYATGILDKMNRMIFENDIVLYKISSNPMIREGIVLYDTQVNQFYLNDIKTKHTTPFYVNEFSLFSIDKLEIISHAFNHT